MDGPHNEHHPLHKTLILDLADVDAQDCLFSLLEALQPHGIHIALPCGTGSRARDKPVPAKLRQSGAPCPRPLRSFEHILGVPNLKPIEEARVQTANKLAAFAVRLIQFAMDHSTFISLENPTNSWMWGVLAFFVRQTKNSKLQHFYNAFFALDFDNCCHGGDRPKSTRFLCSHDLLSSLALRCQNDHVHKPYQIWSGPTGWKFDTALESEYPQLLCFRFATLLKQHCQSFASFDVPDLRPTLQQTKRSRALVPEYHKIVQLQCAPKAPHKLLSHSQGEAVRETGTLLPSDAGLEKPAVDSSPNKPEALSKFGIYNTPEQFIRLASFCSHPLDTVNAIPDVLKRNIFEMLTLGCHFRSKKRLEFAKRLVKMKEELIHAEAEFQASLPHHVREVLSGKNVILMKKLLEESSFEDANVADLMQGVDIVGTAEKSALFDLKVQPAVTTPEFLLMSEKWRRKRLEGKNLLKGEPELSKLLWETTMQEVSEGSLQGPFVSLDDLKTTLGVSSVVVNRRFVIIQNGKPRVIDDLKEGGVNLAYTSLDKLVLHDVDFVSVLLQFLSNTVFFAKNHNQNQVEVTLSSQEKLVGMLHSDFQGDVKWEMKCFDLAKAYKQVPLSAESRRFAVLFVHHPVTHLPVYFLSKALPFGASSSVFSFTRLSRALWHLAVYHGAMIGGVFFDDFPMIEPPASAKMAKMTFELLLKSLGWKFSQDEAKSQPFSETCDVLGVRFEVGTLTSQAHAVCNKPSRIEKLLSFLADLKKRGCIEKREAQVVCGILNFATNFVLGHSLKIAMRAFALAGTRPATVTPGELRQLCDWTATILVGLRPRVFQKQVNIQPALIFSDAAFEDGVATWGIVLVDHFSGKHAVFGGVIPACLVEFWMSFAIEQVITQAEAFAALLARRAFQDRILGRRVILFLDNDAARLALIKASSASLSLLQLAQLFHSSSNSDGALVWVDRVPSASNIADWPSRGDEQAARTLLGIAEEPFCFDLDSLVKECVDVSALPTVLCRMAGNHDLDDFTRLGPTI